MWIQKKNENYAINNKTGEIVAINTGKNDSDATFLLEQYENLKENLREANLKFDQVKAALKEKFKEVQYDRIGSYQITGQWVHRKETIQPPSKYWDMRIKKISK